MTTTIEEKQQKTAESGARPRYGGSGLPHAQGSRSGSPERPYSKTDSGLAGKLRKLLAAGDIDQRTLAQRLNYSDGTISQYLSGSYPGNIEKLETAIKKYLKLHENTKKVQRLTLEFRETSVASEIADIANMCQYNGDICVCYGASGLGKTSAIRQIQKEKSGIVVVDPDERASQRTILKQIAEQLKIGELDIYFENAIAEVVRRLNNSGYLIIIDEAENLDSSIFRMIRKIHDRCNFTIGVLFVGTERLKGNLLKFKGEYDYVLNRIRRIQVLKPLTDNDIRLLVEEVFPDCGDECMRAFRNLCNRNARVLLNMLKGARDMVASYNEPLNVRMVEDSRALIPA